MSNYDAERRIALRQAKTRLAEIAGTIFTPRQPIGKLWRCVTGPGKGPERMPKSGWEPFAVMGRWGHFDQTTWFKMKAQVPKAFAGNRVVAMLNPCAHTDIPGVQDYEESGEGLAYVNGQPFQGIDRHHDFMVLTERAKGGEAFEIALECCPQTRFDATHVFRYADLAVMHPEAWDFYWDGCVYLDVVAVLEDGSATRRRLLNLVVDAIKRVDLQHLGQPSYFESLVAARRFLHQGLKAFGTSHGMGALTLIGQSHIDTAWLWPLRETRRKVGRTWSTVLKLMEQYPEYHFSASQPALYQFAKENHPEIYRAIKKRAKEGRWEPCGAAWVEQDNNVPSGESLIRQFLYGNRFLEQEFGMRSRTAWLPDAFGFPWSLPQIMAQCGIETFFTIKISWSEFTTFPYGYFLWQGVDGTRIRAIMTPENYNGNPIPKDLINQRNSFQQKELLDETPFPFGFGDGGGGPTPQMLEYGKRLRNIAGVPRCRFGRTEDCFDRMRAAVDDRQLPVYSGELYLELHRGCQTTQARTKRNNRKCEVLMHNTEFLAAMSLLRGGAYNQPKINEAWRIILTNQFHDILPGSSINEVYQQAEKDYAQARALATTAMEQALERLLPRIDTAGPGKALVAFNSLSWVRSDVAHAQVRLPRGNYHVTGPDGQIVPSQVAEDGALLFEVQAVPPLGYAVYHLASGKAEAAPSGKLKATPRLLENDYLRIRLDASGRFTSVFDKVEAREVLAPGSKGNELQLFDDRPGANDAWDIDYNFEDRQWAPGKAESLEVVEHGPVRAVLRVVRKTERSVITQDITLYALLPRVDVCTRVDWHEKRTLLKVAFPVDVHTHRATCHIQFATAERATHRNTDFDTARFEVPAHHWADLSEGDYGVSLLNDCKYGYDVKDNVLRLSLLRSPIDPDPHADEGEHVFTYSLYPHGGDWRNGTVQQGYELNHPLLVAEFRPSPGPMPKAHAFASIDAGHVILDTVKKAEDSRALIVRLYEAYGQRGDISVTFGPRPKTVSECDLMEEQDKPIACHGHRVSLYVKPYEIRTLKVMF